MGFPRVGGDDAFARCVFLRLSVWWQSIVGIRSGCLSWDTPTGSRSQRSLPPPHPNGDGACCTSTGTPAPPPPSPGPAPRRAPGIGTLGSIRHGRTAWSSASTAASGARCWAAPSKTTAPFLERLPRDFNAAYDTIADIAEGGSPAGLNAEGRSGRKPTAPPARPGRQTPDQVVAEPSASKPTRTRPMNAFRRSSPHGRAGPCDTSEARFIAASAMGGLRPDTGEAVRRAAGDEGRSRPLLHLPHELLADGRTEAGAECIWDILGPEFGSGGHRGPRRVERPCRCRCVGTR